MTVIASKCQGILQSSRSTFDLMPDEDKTFRASMDSKETYYDLLWLLSIPILFDDVTSLVGPWGLG